MRQRLTWLLITTIVLVFSTGAVLTGLAVAEPFVPGDALYPLQDWASGVRALTIIDPAVLAEHWLDDLEQHVADLEERTGQTVEPAILVAADGALDRAVAAVDAAPDAERSRLRQRLFMVVARYEEVLRGLAVVPKSDPRAYAVAVMKAHAVVAAVSTDNAGVEQRAISEGSRRTAGTSGLPIATATAPARVVAAHGVPFPPLATAGPHDFFPLVGEHVDLDCKSCHSGGAYSGTPRECSACHAPDAPAPHFVGECSSCHTASGWKPATFDHSGFTDCASCHTKDKPANHYAGQCSSCHGTRAWRPATFDHSGFTDCASCHTVDKPANHYDGQCSLCHRTDSWSNAVFNHSTIGTRDCLACHAAPTGHWAAPCARCHTDTGNWKAVRFDHSVIGTADCGTCHAARKPANHYAGACSTCHTDTGNWRNARFNHATIGSADCSACHVNRAPANHFGGPCSTCHTDTGNWKNATFNHNSIGNADCSSCHTPPGNHFPAPCANCHKDTGNWKNANFNHTFPTNHGGASCSSCHANNNYGSWSCDSCHSPSKMADEHDEESGFNSNCIQCHADGEEHD